jgi:hypothetical protein
VWVIEMSEMAAWNMKLCYFCALFYWNTLLSFCGCVFVTRNCTLCIKSNAIIQGCPVGVLNEEITIGKPLTGNKDTESRNVGAQVFKINVNRKNRLKKR